MSLLLMLVDTLNKHLVYNNEVIDNRDKRAADKTHNKTDYQMNK